MISRKLATSVALVIPLSLPSYAAEDPLSLNPASPWYALDFNPGWYFDLGAGIEYEPTYAGSDEYVSEGDLIARALYRSEHGHRYFIGLGELGLVYSLSKDWQFLAFLEYEEGRNDDEDKTLSGLDSIDSTVEGQFMLTRRLGNASLFAVLQPDLLGNANKGLVWFIGAGYDSLSKNQQWRYGTTIDISGADKEYMSTEFGITAEEAERTKYPPYEPDAGLKSLTWNINAEYYISDRLSILGSIDSEYYATEATDSPLISDEGAALTYEASLQLRYRF